MKTVLSIPDDVFARAERFATRTGRSRSGLYTAAPREYLGRHEPEDMTDAMNRACDAIGAGVDLFVAVAGHSALERTEW